MCSIDFQQHCVLQRIKSETLQLLCIFHNFIIFFPLDALPGLIQYKILILKERKRGEKTAG